MQTVVTPSEAVYIVAHKKKKTDKTRSLKNSQINLHVQNLL